MFNFLYKPKNIMRGETPINDGAFKLPPSGVGYLFLYKPVKDIHTMNLSDIHNKDGVKTAST